MRTHLISCVLLSFALFSCGEKSASSEHRPSKQTGDASGVKKDGPTDDGKTDTSEETIGIDPGKTDPIPPETEPVITPTPTPVPTPMPDPVVVPDPMQPKPYSPCPMEGDCKIMPLGDSITFGINGYSQGGYRIPLLRKAWAAKRKMTFVGDLASGPAMIDGKAFPQGNQGHRGWTIEDIMPGDGRKREGILEIVDEALKKHKPHIVLLQIGTNDMNTNADVANAPKRLSKLLDKMILNAPDALIVVAQIVPARSDAVNNRVKVYNAAIPAIVKEKVAKGKHVLLVDQYKAIVADPDWKTKRFADTLHPKDAGFDVMANVWWEAIKNHLK